MMRKLAAWRWVVITVALSGCGGGGGNDAGPGGDTGGALDAGGDGSLPDGDATVLPDINDPGDAGDVVACGAPSRVCNGACVDVRSDPVNCGACGTVCGAGATCSAGACACPSGQIDCYGVCAPVASIEQCPPRQLAPLSAATVTRQQPKLYFALPSTVRSAHLEICADAACTQVEQSLEAPISPATPSAPLSRGWHFWHVRSTDGTVYGPTWEFWVGSRSAPVDASWGVQLDVNRDGAPELATMDGQGLDVYPGSRTGLGTTPTRVAPPGGAAELLQGLSRAGDVNGDGFGDLVAGSSESGNGYLYLGGEGGLSTTPITFRGTQDVRVPDASMTPAGDVNGDGYADLLAVSSSPPAALVFFGGPRGFASPPQAIPEPTGGTFGKSVAGACDVNADGYADVAIGKREAGANPALIYLGSIDGLRDTPVLLVDSTSSGVGDVVACAGDVNGDGYPDVATGSAVNNAVLVFGGSATGVDGLSIWELAKPTSASAFGTSIAGLGDANGDGYDDVLVTAATTRSAYLFAGADAGPAVATTAIIANDAVLINFGHTAYGPGDLNGDGFADAVVGGLGAGRLALYPGDASGLDDAALTLIMAPSVDSGFGDVIASLGAFARPSFPHQLASSPSARRAVRVCSARVRGAG